jgi:hypothetical protein
MPKIVRVITNTNPSGVKPWILQEDYAEHFTQQEMDEILTPYFQFVASLTGFVETTQEEIDDTLVVKIEFDTMENLTAAENQISGADANIIVKTRMEFFKNRIQEMGGESTFAHHIE